MTDLITEIQKLFVEQPRLHRVSLGLLTTVRNVKYAGSGLGPTVTTHHSPWARDFQEALSDCGSVPVVACWLAVMEEEYMDNFSMVEVRLARECNGVHTWRVNLQGQHQQQLCKYIAPGVRQVKIPVPRSIWPSAPPGLSALEKSVMK